MSWPNNFKKHFNQSSKIMGKFTLTIEMQVSDNWIEDGCNPHSDAWKGSIELAIAGLLPYAYGHEVKAKLTNVTGTTNEACRKLQGY